MKDMQAVGGILSWLLKDFRASWSDRESW